MSIDDGCIAAISGLSGSGKTTLLNCLGLLQQPTSGRIVYGGEIDATKLGYRARLKYRRHNIGYLLQTPALVENETVSKNLRLVRTRRQGGLKSEEEVLERVGLAGIQKEKIYHLSGGEQQRIALAQLLIKNPSIVLLDEPTSALDNDNTHMVIDVMNELSAGGASIIAATHSNQIRACADIEYEMPLNSRNHRI
ncbi:ATP-binding cassette domain-containing protein [Pseudonocardia sp. ICBG601]|uniref:ATP-binding cassette domain-containing protein n=1 Tax=Pseudonocardia sp. ICBG601 TaxID=2846759 RepID=UPI001CF62176|nr:ATP-binding cassette domain-containing protein [Pseudonocardia sp. ICBG601]